MPTTDLPKLQEPVPVRRSPQRSKRPRIAAVAIALVVALIGGAWWLGLLTAEPEAVSLASTVQAVEAENEAAAVEQTQAAAPTVADIAKEPTPDVASDDATEQAAEDAPLAAVEAAGEPAGIAGTWTIVTSSATFAGYRADSRVGEAVGRTPGVAGSLVATDAQVTAVNITVDMTQLTSDSSLRDEHLGDEGIEYNVYPTSVFELTDPIDITTIPAEGVAADFQAVGNLTVRAITLPVTINLEGTLVGDQLVIAGSADINLDDYGASVSTNTAVMEFSLLFTK